MGQIQSVVFRNFFARETTVDGASSAVLRDQIFEMAALGQAGLLADWIDATEFDLTTLDDSTGETLLHRALSAGQNDVVMMLLDRAGNDSRVIDVKDRDGYTPLMRAAAVNNVPMMQALVERGARSDDRVEVPALSPDSDAWLEMSIVKPQIVPDASDALGVTVSIARRRYGQLVSGSLRGSVDVTAHAAAAQMLVDARGDLSRAFEMAVERKSAYAAKFYFDALRDAVAPVRDLAAPSTRRYDVLAALLWAQQSGDESQVEAITKYEVISALLRNHMQGYSDSVKIVLLRRMIDAAGAAASKLAYVASHACRRLEPTNAWTENACDTVHFDHLRLLIAAGVRCDPLLVDVFRSAPPVVLQKFGAMEIDCHTMMVLVRECIGDVDDAPQKIAALLPGVLKGLFAAERLSEQKKLAALRALPLEHARPAVTQIMLDLVQNGQSLAPVRLLIEADASTIDVLGELAKAKNRGALLKFIRMGANPFAAMAELVNRGEREAAHQLAVAVALEYAPAGPGNPGRPRPRTQPAAH